MSVVRLTLSRTTKVLNKAPIETDFKTTGTAVEGRGYFRTVVSHVTRTSLS